MLTVIFILITIACILLVLIILAQSPKSGLASQLGGSVSQILGARQAPDALEKGTWYFGIGIIVAIAITYFMLTPGTGDKKEKALKTEGADYRFAPTASQPAQQQGAQGQGIQPAGPKPATPKIEHGNSPHPAPATKPAQ